MAAGHSKLSTHPGAELFLSRFAEGEWLGVVRPWLEACRGTLGRSLVVAPTRGHTHALKRRCMAEDVALLGVEFLTPGLARKKRGAGADPGRDLQLLILRTRIESRMALLDEKDPARLIWRSLASDLEVALGDFDDLIRAGFQAEHFPRAELREVFGEMAEWMARHGFVLGPIGDRAAALERTQTPVADRLLLLPGGPECRGEFFGLAALAWRCPSITVALPEPEFGGGGAGDEAWVEAWEKILGINQEVVEAPDPTESCASVAELWGGEGKLAENVEVIVGRSRLEEMERVAERIVSLLRSGSDNIAVVFPRADPAHVRLARRLDALGVPFADLIGTSGTPPTETRVQRAMVDFYEKGGRLEELLALWPLLKAQNLVRITVGKAREACQRLFDRVQSHAVEPQLALLEASEDAEGREVGRVARLLLPAWPAKLTLSDALDLFESARDRINPGAPAGWAALRDFAGRVPELMPAGAILEAIRAFLPEKGPVEGAPNRSGFAHVTLTTARRAAGVAWSETIFVESNRGVWPERRESSCWLGDKERRELAAQGEFRIGPATADERMALERRLYSAISRDTAHRVIFSEAEHDDEDPEVRLEPNPWLERVQQALRRRSEDAGAGPPAAIRENAPRHRSVDTSGVPAVAGEWLSVWRRRRDPEAPFDEFFLADPAGRRPTSLSAKQIEAGIGDPARFWFDAVIHLKGVDWKPFQRARRKQIGVAVHDTLAKSLRGTPHEGFFFELPGRGEAQARLDAELEILRARWPSDRYWDSFFLEVSGAANALLSQVFSLPRSTYAAVETWVPKGATVPVGIAGRIAVRGRMDLVLSDKPAWQGAQVQVVDFKTGSDTGLSVKSMASRGASLQLGIYLEAARSAGASGAVWMLKPDKKVARIDMAELPGALAKLEILGWHLASGIYGALTPDRTDYTHGFQWPLACAPIGAAVLQLKFDRTFGAGTASASEESPDE
jgi:hypothetical protein